MDYGSGNDKLYDLVGRSNQFASRNDEPSKTVQSDAEDADINTIVRRFGLTGQLPQSLRLPEYGDYDLVSDYHSALLAIQDADAQFMSLPADVRSRFDNDAGRFFDYAADPSNIDGLRELGLAKPKPVEIIPAGGVDKPE
ncbi:MAG: internal scaffolding protein [Microvirus sp.]|nr:MAG: internal scaffolding protein [Microvirus sp.]